MQYARDDDEPYFCFNLKKNIHNRLYRNSNDKLPNNPETMCKRKIVEAKTVVPANNEASHIPIRLNGPLTF